MHGASAGVRRRTTPAPSGASLRPALPAMAEEVDPVMRDRETSARRHPFGQRTRVRFGNGCLDIRDAPAAQTREVMMRSRVGVEACPWPGQFTEQPRVDEQPEVPVDGAQAHPWLSPGDQAVDFFGSGVPLDAPDNLEHRVTRSGQPEPSAPQRDLGALDARRVGIVRCPSNSRFGDDSHFHQPWPGVTVTLRGLDVRVKQRCEAITERRSTRSGDLGGQTFADQAMIAIENVRLFTEVGQAISPDPQIKVE